MTIIKPIGDRVLVKLVEEKETIKGGILIPESAKDKPQEAKVIALGTGGRDENGQLIPFEVAVGDTILLPKYGAVEVSVDDEKYLLVKQGEILAITNSLEPKISTDIWVEKEKNS